MASPVARPLLHAAHASTFLALLATGLLVLSPDLRAAVVGGYSLFVLALHRWSGVAFVLLPLAVAAFFGRRALAPPPGPRSLRALWQGGHMAITVLLAVVFTVTGFALWLEDSLSMALVDASREVHAWLTLPAALLLVAHLLEVAVAAFVARLAKVETATEEMREGETGHEV